jgi:hypothetical protein
MINISVVDQEVEAKGSGGEGQSKGDVRSMRVPTEGLTIAKA